MPCLAVAGREQIAAIYRESHALWGVGLSPADYRGLWDEIRSTPWARRHARFYAWQDEAGRPLSSLKLYRPRIRVLGVESRASILGAIFTPKTFRGAGHASDLVRHVLTLARDAGDAVALLFSDIGTAYYERLGFRPLPAREQWGAIPRRSRAADDDWQLRPATPSDLPDIARAHQRTMSGRPLALLRDPEHWHFLHVRTEAYFRRLADASVTHQTWIGLWRGRFAGFLNTVEGRGEWNVREVAAADGAAETMAEILRAGAVRARSAGMRRCYAWLPPEIGPQLRDWRLRVGPRLRAVPMIVPLRDDLDLDLLDSPAAAFIPYQDQF